MKQIGNWVFGSFFRTIGRLLVFVLLGILLAHLIDFGSLKDSFSITDLFFTKIKASTFYNHWGGDIKTNNTNWTSGVNAYYQQYSFNTYTNYDSLATWTNTFDHTNEYIKIYGYFYNIDFDPSEMECLNTDCTIWQENNYKKLEFQVWLGDKSRQCKIDYNIPNISNATGDYIFWEATCTGLNSFNTIYYRLSVIDANTTTHTFNLGLNKVIYYSVDNSSSINSAINSQTQQQQQNHEETQSYLEDSNTTQAENEATDFFDDFDAPDAGGLSAIITAPLNTIRSLLNSSCTNLVLPLPYVNENLTLPCMTSIYTQHFGAFFTIYQTIILAIIAYRCIRSIFFDIHGFTNPNDDRIEVMDL